MININKLNISFKDITVIKDFSLTVEPGESILLFGQNGTGKSSIIKSIMGLVDYTGTIEVNSLDISKDYLYKKYVGYVPDSFSYFEYFTFQEYLKDVSLLRGYSYEDVSKRINLYLSSFGIESFLNQKISSLSKGTKLKLTILLALIHKPKVLLLDEPYDGLDIQSSELLSYLLSELNKIGVSIVLTTHLYNFLSILNPRIVKLDNEELNILEYSRKDIDRLVEINATNIVKEIYEC